jgi:hypothetical protein
MKYVGRTEKVSFPELGIESTEAKVDTGAYGNALHVDDIFIKENKLFFVIDDKEYIYDKYKTIVVRNSFGKKQKRFSISTKMILGEKHYKIHISLTNRKKMKYSVLIGRRFLRKFEYMVNVKRKNINDRAKTV